MQYDPSQAPAKNWRPTITAVVAHNRQSAFNDPTGSPGGFVDPHVGSGNFLLMDGSVKTLNASIHKRAMWALCTRITNGEVIGEY